eukprot:TRINITY_DN7173_c0_g1_i1.p1 TRINITY_DN7173_c0_g1~~TRINITY_DN7173_c0_g1_i1.p1  ORF type:complete len:541 (+),score=111.95 TRINITY_DN7173_c0_g1_i1:38-1660(+)
MVASVPFSLTQTLFLSFFTGARLLTGDKQVLMGHENDHLVRALAPCEILQTPLGRIGLYCCMDGVILETPRGLALGGAQLMLNSLNSFSLDEASLHIPVRAGENKVFVIAANKVGPLAPPAMLEQVAKNLGIDKKHLDGAGESQIVAPDGTVLAKAPLFGEAVIYADINVADADCKLRPDGTDIFAARRPELYQPIAEKPLSEEDRQRHVASLPPVPESIRAAVLQLHAEGAAAIDEAVAAIAALPQDVALVVLPELFCFEGGVIGKAPGALPAALARADEARNRLAAATTNTPAYVVASLPFRTEAGLVQHVGFVFAGGCVAYSQPQLHLSKRHAHWLAPAALGASLRSTATPFGRLAVLVGDDSIFPEIFRVAALQDVEVAALSSTIVETWEVATGLVERAAENRINVVAASRPIHSLGLSSIVLALHREFSFWTKWTTREFDGNMNSPIVTRGPTTPDAATTIATLYPVGARNKIMSKRTHLLDSRPWYLAEQVGICGAAPAQPPPGRQARNGSNLATMVVPAVIVGLTVALRFLRK